MKFVTAILLSLCLAGKLSAAAPPAPYGPLPNAAQLAWHEVEFYAIIHHSLNTYTDQEWGYGNESVTLFNPSNFNARAIADVCKQAGMRGINVVAKHHCGFCIWPSAYTDSINSRYNVANTNCPWKSGTGDMLRDYSDACAEYGLKLGAYLSPWDRNHADYGYSNYVSYYHNQLREVTTNYGPLFILWFDGANGGNGWYGGCNCTRSIDASTYYDWPTIYGIVASNQPLATTFGGTVRWVGNESGYADSPCWATMGPGGSGNATSGVRVIGTNGVWKPAEADSKLRNGWFYHASEDNTVKSAATLFDTYFQTIGNGCAWDLGLAPDKSGVLHTNDVTALLQLGNLIRRTFSNNLARTGSVVSGNSRGGDAAFSPANLIDTNRTTYWSTDDTETNATMVLNFAQPVTFSVVGLREYLPLGLRVNSWAVDAWVNGQWQLVSTNAGIGAHRFVRCPTTVTDQVRLRVFGPVAPAISEFGLYLEGVSDIWTGGGTNDNWSTAENWGGTTPASGDSLTFIGTTRKNNTNDLSNLSVGTVQIANGGFTLSGNALALTSVITNVAGTNAINLNLDLGSGAGISSAGSLSLGGIISGSSGTTFRGSGNFTVDGVNTLTGNVTIDQATLTVSAGKTLGWSGAGWPVQVLAVQNGGVLRAYDFGQGVGSLFGELGDGATTLTLNNGTFRLLASDSASINRGVTIGSGGGTLEVATGVIWTWGTTSRGITANGPLALTGAGSATVNRPISGSGALIKSGPGTWTLGRANTYSGGTTVQAGTLALSSSGTLGSGAAITVASGAVLDASARGGLNISSSQTLTAGGVAATGADLVGNLTNKGALYVAGSGTPGTLGISGNVVLSGGTLYFDLANVTTPGAGINDLITNSGSLHLSGTNVLQITMLNGSLAPGTYTLVSGTALGSGAVSNLVLGTGLPSGGRQSFALDTTSQPGKILLQVSGSAAAVLRWTGTNGNAWNLTTTNWLNGASPDRYFNLDSILFSDASTNGSVSLATTLYPGSVTVSNATTTYTFNGAGGIGGATGLNKSGAGNLVLAGSNTFTGPVAINSGTLQIGAGGTAGSLVALINNSAALVFNRSDNIVFTNSISGSGTLAQSGSGTLTLSNNFAYTGNTFANAGILALAPTSGAAFPGNAVVNVGGTLRLDKANSLAPTSLVTVSPGGTFDLNGRSCALGALAGAGSLANSTSLYLDLRATSHDFGGALGGAVYVRGANGLGGTQVLSGNSTVTTLFVGYQSGNLHGNLELAAGSLTVNGDTYIGGGTTLSASENVLGSLTVSGGTLTLNGANFYMGQSVNGTTKVAQFTQTGGSVIVNAGWTGIANGGGTSQLDLSGGSFTLSPTATYPGLQFGVRGNVTLNISGTAQVSVPYVKFLNAAAGDGKFATLNLSGGTLTVGFIGAGTTLSTSTLNLNGGTLRASASSATFLEGLTTAYVQDGGAVFDDAGNSITINQALISGGSGGLTKLGSGTLTLNGANTYSGTTAVNAGTLALGVTGSFDTSAEVRLQSGARLDTTAHAGLLVPWGQTLSGAGSVIGNTTINGIVSPGTNGLGTLSFSNNLALAGIAQMEINTSAPGSNDVLAVAGALNLGGTLVVTNTGPTLIAGDSFRLLNATNVTSQFSSFNLPALEGGLFWNRGLLTVNGALRVESRPTLQVQPLAGGATNLALQVQSSVGLNYILETTAVLAPSPAWTAVTTNQGTGGTLVFNVPVQAAPQMFIRLRIE